MTHKDRIIEQAMQMFVREGIKSVRMDDIAQQLGISKRTLYELFGDKEGLLYLSMACYFDRECEQWEAQCRDARNVLDAMFMVLNSVMDQASTTGRLMDNLRKFHPAVHDKLMHDDKRKNRESLRLMLHQGIDEGLFVGHINIDLAISVLHYTASALVTHHVELALPEGLTEREAFVQTISTFFRGISTAKGLQMIDDYMERYKLSGKHK